MKVLVQREGQEAQHCVYARRTSPSCYEARWTMKPEDLTANYTFQVLLVIRVVSILYRGIWEHF